MSAKVLGVPASMNCVGPVVLAMESNAGGFEFCNIMEGAHKQPEFTALNPYQQVPVLQDGDITIGESNAILRYLARKYKPEVYPTNAAEAATIDFALDSFARVYKAHTETVYVTYGYAARAKSQAAANGEYVAAVTKWMDTFVRDETFAGGDQPNLADYKAAPFFFAAVQPANKQLIGLEMPARVRAYVDAFVAAVGASAFMQSAGGYSLKEYAATRAAQAQAAVSKEEPKGEKENKGQKDKPIDSFLRCLALGRPLDGHGRAKRRFTAKGA